MMKDVPFFRSYSTFSNTNSPEVSVVVWRTGVPSFVSVTVMPFCPLLSAKVTCPAILPNVVLHPSALALLAEEMPLQAYRAVMVYS